MVFSMRLFGLTGGIASGKSTVAKRFRARGVVVIDADSVAREVVLPGAPVLAELSDAFGADIVVAGVLDRAALARAVFGDRAKEQKLASLMHPLIAARTQELANRQAAAGALLCCYEASLLVENGLADAFRPLVVVTVSERVQRARLQMRDARPAVEDERRIGAQLPSAEKTKVADYVIENNGPEDALCARADEVLDALCALLGLPRFPATPG
jgi:dephospho-CoA kinase